MGLLTRLKEAKAGLMARASLARIEGLAFIAGAKVAGESFVRSQLPDKDTSVPIQVESAVVGLKTAAVAFVREELSSAIANGVVATLENPDDPKNNFVGRVVATALPKIAVQVEASPVAMERVKELTGLGIDRVVELAAKGNIESRPIVGTVEAAAMARLREQLDTETGKQAAEEVLTRVAQGIADHPEQVKAMALSAVATVNNKDTRTLKEKVFALPIFKKSPQDAPIVNWFKNVSANIVEKGFVFASKVYATGKSLIENKWGNFNKNAKSFMDAASATLSFYLMPRQLKPRPIRV
ncbi:hypothetical protein A2872_02085 [Candidatus Gottesmanbacteria bacterium RIFCSPHIGHO2_01_FULL_42_12]|uniref:Uncharacterized protein n=1 Tax=Candidatus Gottesmanbacteria bacterium RIFCSPHIGHO2_01_FULL_42_12 TaxID=1798377 RepID=A0A1F5Z5M0_9BACT|nr:MAG: hypothetical protein A2872_02085 [Candidatus Gottesmanbacteria bacterium RIFCSPHIGHO2_01_FULL_42_12]